MYIFSHNIDIVSLEYNQINLFINVDYTFKLKTNDQNLLLKLFFDMQKYHNQDVIINLETNNTENDEIIEFTNYSIDKINTKKYYYVDYIGNLHEEYHLKESYGWFTSPLDAINEMVNLQTNEINERQKIINKLNELKKQFQNEQN